MYTNSLARQLWFLRLHANTPYSLARMSTFNVSHYSDHGDITTILARMHTIYVHTAFDKKNKREKEESSETCLVLSKK